MAVEFHFLILVGRKATEISLTQILIYIISFVCKVLGWAIIIDAILSWVPQYNETVYKIRSVLQKITEPVTEPVRKLIGPLTASIGIDFTPIAAIILIDIVQQIAIAVLLRL
ncbi:MAG: YggT family protein [Bacillota bacterium]|nr:YggT family protein [Bacillota bacterium]